MVTQNLFRYSRGLAVAIILAACAMAILLRPASADTSSTPTPQPTVEIDPTETEEENNEAPIPIIVNDGVTVRNGAVSFVVSFRIENTGEEQLYTRKGKKLLGIAPDDLRNFASAPVGVSIKLRAESGKKIILTYQGNGEFTGIYSNKYEFGFGRPELANAVPCDPDVLAFAKERVAVLKAESRDVEEAIAAAVLKALKKVCESDKKD